jgi:hypothetical protein
MSADMGQRTKPMVDGMYTRHPQYSTPKHNHEQLVALQAAQGQRCRQKAIARQNARDILSKRLV